MQRSGFGTTAHAPRLRTPRGPGGTSCSTGASASTQNQALSALVFLYEVVLGERLPWMNDIVRAQRPVRLPVVLSPDEVARLLAGLRGVTWLMASLMYGCGPRLLECAELRVKDVHFDRREILVRDGKGGKDRVTMLPRVARDPLERHLQARKAQHDCDLAAGRGSVALPGALSTKYPGAPLEWAWQWVFPATRFYIDPGTGERRRHHLHESVVQRGGQGRGASGRPVAAGDVSQPAALLCDPPARSGL